MQQFPTRLGEWATVSFAAILCRSVSKSCIELLYVSLFVLSMFVKMIETQKKRRQPKFAQSTVFFEPAAHAIVLASLVPLRATVAAAGDDGIVYMIAMFTNS